MCDCNQKCSCSCPSAFDPSKAVQCKGGYKVRIIATDLEGVWPIAAVVNVTSGPGSLYQFTKEGKLQGYAASHPYDLVNVPETTEKYFSYGQAGNTLFRRASAEVTKSFCKDGVLTPLKFTYTDGKLTSVEILK